MVSINNFRAGFSNRHWGCGSRMALAFVLGCLYLRSCAGRSNRAFCKFVSVGWLAIMCVLYVATHRVFIFLNSCVGLLIGRCLYFSFVNA